jgi:hypothetical protein
MKSLYIKFGNHCIYLSFLNWYLYQNFIIFLFYDNFIFLYNKLLLLLLLVLSRVPALTASMMLLYFSLSMATIFQMPAPMFLRSPSTLSSHLFGGHPTLLVPCSVVNVNFLHGWFSLVLKRCSSHLTLLTFISLMMSGSPKSW